MRQILGLKEVTHEFIDLQYDPAEGLKSAIVRMCEQAEKAVRDGKLVLLLSDRYLVKGKLPAHALLVTGAVHHHLVRKTACAASATCSSRPARRAIRIISPASSDMAPRRCIRTWPTRCCSR